MISSVGIGVLPLNVEAIAYPSGELRRPRRHLLEAHEARAPAMLVAAAAVAVGEALLRQHHARAARRRIERHSNLGLVPARAGIVVPAPGEHQALGRLD